MYRSRRVMRRPPAFTTALRLGVAGAILACAGCASSQSQSHVAGPIASADPSYWRVEIEDDGIPAQLAPRNRPPTPDDPTEPWSPNYGSGSSGPAATPERTPESQPPVRRMRPKAASAPATSQQRVPIAAADVAELDADEIIRRAIAEHEMRRAD